MAGEVRECLSLAHLTSYSDHLFVVVVVVVVEGGVGGGLLLLFTLVPRLPVLRNVKFNLPYILIVIKLISAAEYRSGEQKCPV